MKVTQLFREDDTLLALEALNLLSTPVAVFELGGSPGEPLRFLAGNQRFADIIEDSERSARSISRLLRSISRVVAGMEESAGPETVVVPDENDTGYLRITLKFSSATGGTAGGDGAGDGDTDAARPRRVIAEFQRLNENETDWQDLRSRVRQLQDLADNSTALMYVKNPRGQYTIVNRYFANLFGRTVEDILGKTDHDLFDASSADVYHENDRQVLESETAQEAEEPFSQIGGVTDPDPDRRWLSIKFPLLDDSGVPYALGAISTDITARKRAESAARRAMYEAERANRSKSEFLSRMSHELRTPLNAVLGFAELLKRSRLEPEHDEYVSHILEAGRHLLTLVNDVLDISWIEGGAPGITNEVVPASVPLHQALEIVRPLAKQHSIEIASDLHDAIDVGLNVDPQRLRQVFFNLLGNAIKFNRPWGAIRVDTKKKGDELRYLITDTGNGIRPDEIERLFAPFERLSNAAGIEGSGLGLALSRGLIEEMGGRMGVLHTAPGEGTTFFVDLPIATTEIAAGLVSTDTAFDAEADQLLENATVVQIEDTPANLRLLQQVLDRMGVKRLESAASGAAGIELVREVRPDVVFLDLNLNDMSGTSVLAHLREDERLRDIPVIILSADATRSRIAQLRALGAFAYLTKPFDLAVLKATLINAVHARS